MNFWSTRKFVHKVAKGTIHALMDHDGIVQK